MLMIAAAPVFAYDGNGDLTGDCDGFSIRVYGYSWFNSTASYSLTLTGSGGAVSEATGSFEVPFFEVFYPEYNMTMKEYDTTYAGSWPEDLCGTYTVSGSVTITPSMAGYDPIVITFNSLALDCPCEEDGPGTGTPGFWKNHLCAWPVDELVIGGRVYCKALAVVLMNMPVNKDKTYSMFQQLVAAKLNVAAGNEHGCIDAALAAADNWMSTHPVGSGVKASSQAWQSISSIHQQLDDYNNGRLCAPSRDVVGGQVVCKQVSFWGKLRDRLIKKFCHGKSSNPKHSVVVGKAALAEDETIAAFPTVQNFPNPFNPSTTIEFSIPSEGKVTIEIFNTIGERIEVLTQDYYSAGVHAVKWNAASYSSGTYFYRLTAGSYSVAKKMLLVK